MIKYFALCASMMCAYFLGPTWWLWLQVVCLAVLILCDVSSWMIRKRFEVESIEHEIRKDRVRELNPFKWGNE